MLEFTAEYQEAIDSITANRDMKLRQFEMTEEEWEIATQLCDVLKVSTIHLVLTYCLTLLTT
jgi:hypothetical protein